MRGIVPSIVGALALFCSAEADTLIVAGAMPHCTGYTGANFEATITYTYGSGSLGMLEITMVNTTEMELGGCLTGFVFNINSVDADASAVLTSTTNPSFLGLSEESAAPFGIFDAGAAVGGNWEGGGCPAVGVECDCGDTFTFAVTAYDAASLRAWNFITGPNDWDLVVRFRGLNDGSSDKVPAACPPDVNCDGVLDFYDVQTFLNAYSAMEPMGDWNGDGVFDFFDALKYLNDFSRGCP